MNLVKHQIPVGVGIILAGLITLPAPFFSYFYLWIYLGLVIPYFVFTVYVEFIRKKRKKEKFVAYWGYAGLMLLSSYFSMPAIKLFHGQLWIQLIIITFIGLIIWISYRNNQTIYGIAFGEKYRIARAVFHGYIVLVVVVGGGGSYKAPEVFSSTFGHSATMNYFSIILLLCSFWMFTFFTSFTTTFSRFK